MMQHGAFRARAPGMKMQWNHDKYKIGDKYDDKYEPW